MTGPVQIRLFDGPRVELTDPARIITRFRSHNIAALLACLALPPGRMHARDEIADLLWPDAGLDAARNNLRVALSSLRRQLEPPGVPAGFVIVTEGKARVGLNPETTWVDVAAFEDSIRESGRSDSAPARQIALLESAVQVCRGPFLPGFYEDWAVLRRNQLQESLQSAQSRLSALCEEAGDTKAKEKVYAGSSPAPTVNVAAAARPKTNLALPPLPRLPRFLTRFFGRETEVSRLIALLTPRNDRTGAAPDAARLVTLTGAGGSGKTRLAVQAAEQAAPVFPGGVFWVSLIEVTDAGRMAEAIVEAVAAAGKPVGHAPGDGGSSLDRAVAALQGEADCLLVLDNFEHLLEGGEESTGILGTLLARAPNVSCLVTSRQRLLLGVEREFPVPPLPAPAALAGSTTATAAPVEFFADPAQIIAFAAVQLFVDRAQAARPDFQLTPRNAAAVGALCARLDGLPLALELAAGWSLTLTPEKMLARLDPQELELLVTRRRDIAPRHRSLRLVIESSYRLLEPGLQQMLARLSVLRGSWTAEAAQAVCATASSAAINAKEEEFAAGRDILDGLSQLRERSFLLTEEHDDGIRLRMLPLVRAFADEQMTGADKEIIEARHACYFLRRAEEAAPHLRGGPAQTQWINALEADLDNIRAVLMRPESARKGWPDELPLRLSGALGWFWVARSHWREGLHWLRQALAEDSSGSPPSAARARARALYAAGALTSALNLLDECQTYCTQSLEACRLTGDHWGAAFSTGLLGAIAARQGRYAEGCPLLEQSIAAFREIGDCWGTAFTLDNLAHACRDQQDYDRAAALYGESLSLRKARGDRQGMAMSLSNLADTEQLRGDWERAAALHEASLERFRRLGDKAGIGYGLRRLGECALRQGDMARADALNRESLILFRELGDRRRIAECLEKTAVLRNVTGHSASAVWLLGAASALRAAIGIPVPPSEKQAVEDSLASLTARLGPIAVERAWLRGQTMNLETAVRYALEAE